MQKNTFVLRPANHFDNDETSKRFAVKAGKLPIIETELISTSDEIDQSDALDLNFDTIKRDEDMTQS